MSWKSQQSSYLIFFHFASKKEHAQAFAQSPPLIFFLASSDKCVVESNMFLIYMII